MCIAGGAGQGRESVGGGGSNKRESEARAERLTELAVANAGVERARGKATPSDNGGGRWEE